MIIFTHLCGTWCKGIDFANESSFVLRLFDIGLCEAHSEAFLTAEFQDVFLLEELLLVSEFVVILFFVFQIIEIKLRICFLILFSRVWDSVILRY